MIPASLLFISAAGDTWDGVIDAPTLVTGDVMASTGDLAIFLPADTEDTGYSHTIIGTFNVGANVELQSETDNFTISLDV